MVVAMLYKVRQPLHCIMAFITVYYLLTRLMGALWASYGIDF